MRTDNQRLLTATICLQLLLTLASCDPYGGYEYWVDNRSDSTVYAIHQAHDNDTIHITSIEKNTTQLITEYKTINGLYDPGDAFLKYFDSLGIYIDTTNNTQKKKAYSERESWTYKQEVTGMLGKAGNNIYRLGINNEDL